MYCRKCGKFIEGDADTCLDCRAEEAAKQAYLKVIEAHTESSAKPSEEAQPKPPATVEKGARMFGFKRALTSAIFGFASIFATYLAFLFFVALAASTEDQINWILVTMFIIPLVFASVALCVISIVLGIKSIIASRQRTKDGYPLPIATLILGIGGVYLSAICIFLFSYLFIAALAMIVMLT